jgi:hypothetical protein
MIFRLSKTRKRRKRTRKQEETPDFSLPIPKDFEEFGLTEEDLQKLREDGERTLQNLSGVEPLTVEDLKPFMLTEEDIEKMKQLAVTPEDLLRDLEPLALEDLKEMSVTTADLWKDTKK